MAVTLFCGVPKAGKSLAMQDMAALLSEEWPVFAMDSAIEWLPELHDGSVNWRWRGRQLNIIRVPYEESDSAALDWTVENAEEKPGIYVFEKVDGWEPLRVAKLCGQVGNTVFSDDEIDVFASYKEWRENPLKEYLHRGRHTLNVHGVPAEVHIMGAMRRPQSVHTDLTSLANEAFIFRSQGRKTFDRYLSDGFLEEEHVSDVQYFENLQFMRWRNDGTIVKGRLLKPIVPDNA